MCSYALLNGGGECDRACRERCRNGVLRQLCSQLGLIHGIEPAQFRFSDENMVVEY